MTPTNEQVMAAADLIARIIPEGTPGYFMTALEGDHLTVAFAVPVSHELWTQIEQAAGPVAVRFRQVAHDWTTLRAHMDRIGDDIHYWKERNTFISTIGMDWGSNTARISLVEHSVDAARELVERYGASKTSVEEGNHPYAQRC